MLIDWKRRWRKSVPFFIAEKITTNGLDHKKIPHVVGENSNHGVNLLTPLQKPALL